MTTADLRVGILGYGIGGRVFHAPLVAATRGCPSPRSSARTPSGPPRHTPKHPTAEVAANAGRLFALADSLDLVVVSTPKPHPRPAGLRAISHRLPVVVDKPFAPTAVDAETVVRAAKDAASGSRCSRTGVRLGLPHRAEGARLASSARSSAFESRYDRWCRSRRTTGVSRHPAEAGGLLYDLGAHIVDQALQLFGPVAEVYAELDRRREGVAVDDDTFVALHHVNGVRRSCGRPRSPAPAPGFRVPRAPAARHHSTAWTCRNPQIKDASVRRRRRGVEPRPDAGVLGVNDDVETGADGNRRYEQFYRGSATRCSARANSPSTRRAPSRRFRVIPKPRTKSGAERRVVTVKRG